MENKEKTVLDAMKKAGKPVKGAKWPRLRA
jgi:hypothetical protein